MKLIIILIAVFYLSSCASFKEHHARYNFPDKKEMKITIHKLEGGDFTLLAYAEIYENECKIYLRHYPKCLAHEVRHCFEGNWHEGRKTDEEC